MGDSESGAYEGWAIVELMGRRRLGGHVQQAEQYGTAMLRLDVPGDNGDMVATQFYGGSAIYCVTPCSEDAARLVAKRAQPAPVQTWELPRAADYEVEVKHHEDDDDWDDDGD